MNIIVFGPPLAGKGTQCNKLIKKYNFTHLSTGELIRNEIKKETDLGHKAKEFTSNGNFVPDQIVCNVFEKFILESDLKTGFLFDGYPRNLYQVNQLNSFLKKENIGLDLCIEIAVEPSILLERSIKRGRIEGREDDKDIEVVKNRINLYNKHTVPAVKKIKELGFSFVKIDGKKDIEKTFMAIDKNIKTCGSKI